LQGQFSPITATKLVTLARPLLKQLATERFSDTAFEENPFPAVWEKVAHGLAKKAFELRKNGGPAVDQALRNWLLVASFFYACRVPEARLVQSKLNELGRRLSSWPGTMVRLAEYASEKGVCDVRPRETSRVGGVSLLNARSSSLLQHLQDESNRVAAQNGFLARFFANQPGVSAALPPRVTELLAIIRKRRILDFGRPVGVNEVAELEAQVLEISTGSRMLPEFLNDGLEVGQRTNAWQRRRVGRPRLTTEAGEQESGLNHFQGDTAVKPGAGLALV
jgi:hypothetical protein